MLAVDVFHVDYVVTPRRLYVLFALEGKQHMSTINPTLVQAGSAQKPAPAPQGTVTSLKVDFYPAFPKPPVVVVTPFWQRATAVPLPPETVTEVTTKHFVVKSVNGAADYFINWIAVPTP